MKLLYFSNEFPHDDLASLTRQLHLLSKQRRHPVLARFLDEATEAIRAEVRLLPTSLRSIVPPFSVILDFVDHADLRKGPLGASVDGVLLIAVQLGTLIKYESLLHKSPSPHFADFNCRHYEDHPDKYDLNAANTALAGLGLGLLATPAVSLATSVSDLAVPGAEVVRLAFRLGVLVGRKSQNLEPQDPASPPDSWASVVADVAVDDVRSELDSFHDKNVSCNLVQIKALNPSDSTCTENT
jgi:monodictyphenone polyketide synthase